MCGFYILVRVVEVTLLQVAPSSEIILPPLKVYTYIPVTGQIISRTMMPSVPGTVATGAAGAAETPGAPAAGAAGAAGSSGSGSANNSVPPEVDAAKGKVKKGGSKRAADDLDAPEDDEDDEDDIGDD